jgi:hypothetical protein
MSTPRLFCTVLLLAACTDSAPDVTGIAEVARRPRSAASAKSGGGSAAYAYTLGGDIFTPTASKASTAKAQVSNPFYNLSTSPATVTLGTPTGAVDVCSAGSNATYANSFGAVAGRSWVGTLRIATNGTLSFLGTEVNGTATLQFSMSDMTGGPALTTTTNGPATYSYTDAVLFFGGGGVGYDGQYRCVNLTVTATPQ